MGFFIIPIIQNVISHKIEKFNYWESLKKLLSSIYSFIINVLSFKISIWIIVIIIITFITILKAVLFFKKRKSDVEEYEWDNYKTQEYKGLTYKWDVYNYLGEKKIGNVKPICQCGCDLIQQDSYNNYHRTDGYLVCPNCKKGYENNFNENEQALINLVVYNYNKMINNYIKKKNEKVKFNLNDLTKNEKEILNKFYISELNKYTSNKVAIPNSKAVSLLIERGILKKQRESELIDNYTTNGTLFELTEDAINCLNRNYIKKK